MLDEYVGAGILNIITESLYDNPIVVFREYVQNSVDSIFKESNQDDYEIKIWQDKESLCFLDNGHGIKPEFFYSEMVKIGASAKTKRTNLGYKGIGRLSGVPYCKKLTFINILNYSAMELQCFSIDGELYTKMKTRGEEKDFSFFEIMNTIGASFDQTDIYATQFYIDIIHKYNEMLEKTNTGFLVVLQDISPVLKNTIEDSNFFNKLQWLLPVDFEEELYDCEKNELFRELTGKSDGKKSVISFCKISYNDNPVLRPIKKDMLRDYLCKSNYKYAVGFHSFNRNKIAIDRSNTFTGIRIYIDNMLLCTEDELIKNLENYGLLTHTINGQMQSVRGIGAVIYITDKVNISANARRTFIEVTDNDSLEFLKLIAEFVNTVYDARYALSYYVNALDKHEKNSEYVKKLKEYALDSLKKLAKENIELPIEPEETSFDSLTVSEQKKLIKSRIVKQIDVNLKKYLSGLTEYNYEDAYEAFIDWLINN